MLDAPKLRGATFQPAVTERYRRRETGVEEAIIEMYLAGVSTRRIEDVSGILWGAGVSAGTVSNLNEKAFESVDAWRTRPLSGGYPYLFVDGIYLKRSRGGSYENVAVMVAIGANSEGRREIAGCAEGFAESKESWKEFVFRQDYVSVKSKTSFTKRSATFHRTAKVPAEAPSPASSRRASARASSCSSPSRTSPASHGGLSGPSWPSPCRRR